MNSKMIIIITLILNIHSIKTYAKEKVEEKKIEDKKIIVIVESNNGKELPKDVDPILASTINGLNTVQRAADKTGSKDCGCDGTYISYTMGDGRASEGGSLQYKAFELRVGKQLSERTHVDIIHVNEGHPINNHRDGFAVQGVYKQPITENLSVEVGAGPYFSMNTTTINGKELDDKNLGLLGTVAALYSLDSLYPGLAIRAQYNHVAMPGAVSTDAILVGAEVKFGGPSEGATNTGKKTEVAVIGDHFKTNHGGTSAAQGYQIEMKGSLTEHTAGSVSYMYEGKDTRVDRQGVATQYWYVQQLPQNVSVSAGAGPYVAQNQLDKSSVPVNGLISMEIKKDVNKNVSVFVRINRIADFSGSNDRDILGLGVSAKF